MARRGQLLLEMRDVHVDYYGARLLRGIDWELRQGENWAILGPNGAGKTSLLRLAAGELWPHFDNGGRRVYHLDGESTESPIDARRHISFLCAEHQEKYHRHRWDMPARDVVLTGLTRTVWFQGRPGPGQRDTVDAIIAEHGLEEIADQPFLTLSTGQARRVLLARALAGRPRILLLDEYLNGLDAPSRAAISRIIHEAAAAGATLVMTSHRPEEFSAVLTHYARMEEGRFAETGRWKGAPGKTRPVRAVKPGRRPTPNGAGTPLVEVEDCNVVIAGTRILRGVSWRLRAGENWAVVGANGSGKSTFLDLVSGARPPYLGGHVRWEGREEGVTAAERHRLMGIVSPAVQAVYHADVPAEEVVLSGFHGSTGIHGTLDASKRERAWELMGEFGLEGLAGKPFGSLSYGERRRLLLARALVHRPRILLLDEPCDGLDAAARAAFLSAMEGAAAEGVAVVYTTHHPSEMLPRTNRIARIGEGRLAAGAPVKDLPAMVACHG